MSVEQRKLDNKNDHKGLKLDRRDLENIKNALDIYNKLHPRGQYRYYDEKDPQTNKIIRYIEYQNIDDHLSYVRKTLKQERQIKNVFKKGFTDPIRLTISVPPSLEAWLNKGYPKLFTDQVQTEQFLRAFPQFDLSK